MNKTRAKYILLTILTGCSLTLLSGCVTQSFENDEPIVKNQANRNDMAVTRVSLGLGYLKMGDMAQAKLNLEKAKRFSPDLVQVHTAFAHYYETVGEEKLAVESFEQALSIEAESADTLNNYGVFLCRQNKVAAAEVQFLKAIAVPSYLLVSQSYENLASCYLQNDDFSKAEMYLEKSVYHSPNRTSTLLQMVRLQYAMSDYKESKRFLQKFERNTQRFTSGSLALAYKLYWKLDKRRTASNYANMLVKMYPQSWEAKQYLLNELELIDADNLAKKYQLTQKQKKRQLPSSSTKRVVKLSPRKSDESPYTQSVQKTVPKLVKSTAIPAVSAETALLPTSVTKADLATNSIPIVQAGLSVAGLPIPPTEDVALSIGNDSVNTAVIDSSAADLELATVVEFTSTKPTPAERDLPLPEALSEEVVYDDFIAQINDPIKDKVDNNVDVVESLTEEVVYDDFSVQINDPIKDTVDNAVDNAVDNNVDVVEPLTEEVVYDDFIAQINDPIKDTVEDTVDNNVDVVEPLAENIDAVDRLTNEVLSDEIAIGAEKVDLGDAIHKVESGENLYNISVKYNIKLSALRQWNGISKSNKINIGDKLYVVDPQTVKNINDE
jgi:type IV pilus assembly protein PilF